MRIGQEYTAFGSVFETLPAHQCFLLVIGKVSSGRFCFLFSEERESEICRYGQRKVGADTPTDDASQLKECFARPLAFSDKTTL